MECRAGNGLRKRGAPLQDSLGASRFAELLAAWQSSLRFSRSFCTVELWHFSRDRRLAERRLIIDRDASLKKVAHLVGQIKGILLAHDPSSYFHIAFHDFAWVHCNPDDSSDWKRTLALRMIDYG